MPEPKLTVWEYAQQAVPAAQLLPLCQQAGQEGWELCVALPIGINVERPVLNDKGVLVRVEQEQVPGVHCVFKRPQQGEGTQPANGAPVNGRNRLILP